MLPFCPAYHTGVIYHNDLSYKLYEFVFHYAYFKQPWFSSLPHWYSCYWKIFEKSLLSNHSTIIYQLGRYTYIHTHTLTYCLCVSVCVYIYTHTHIHTMCVYSYCIYMHRHKHQFWTFNWKQSTLFSSVVWFSVSHRLLKQQPSLINLSDWIEN